LVNKRVSENNAIMTNLSLQNVMKKLVLCWSICAMILN